MAALTIADRITRAKRLTFTDDGQYSDAEWLIDINEIYQKICGALINRVDEDFFLEIVKQDATNGINEYVIENIQYLSGDIVKIDKVSKIGIKYNTTDIYYHTAKYTAPSDLVKDDTYYETSIPQGYPIFTIRDKSIFIYPKPDTTIVEGLKLNCIYRPIDLLSTDTEDAIKLPRQYNDLLDIGMKQFVYTAQNKINEKNDAISEFNNALDVMVNEINDRYIEPIVEELPNMDYLK